MPAVDNPLTRVYSAIWALLESDDDFAALVAVGNRIKFDSETDREPIKQTITTADVPEVMLTHDGSGINLFDSSSSTKVVSRFSLIGSSGDFRLGLVTHNLIWLLLCRLKEWQSTLSALTWKGEHFVKRVGVLDLNIGQTNPERNRGINGFSAVWTLEIEQHFKTSNLTFLES